MRGFFHNILRIIKNIFWGRNLLWHLLVIALTYVFVVSGFDWFYFQATRSAALQVFFWPAVLAGAFIPLFRNFAFLSHQFGLEKIAKLAGYCSCARSGGAFWDFGFRFLQIFQPAGRVRRMFSGA